MASWWLGVTVSFLVLLVNGDGDDVFSARVVQMYVQTMTKNVIAMRVMRVIIIFCFPSGWCQFFLLSTPERILI